MYKLICNTILILAYCCSNTLHSESLSFPETEADWCLALELHPNCSNTNWQGKGIAMRSAIRVQFYPNSAIMSTTIDSKLDALGRALRTANNVTIVVEGHTDSIGNERYNIRLSKKRAQTVRKYLISKYAIKPQRLRAIGYGERYPIARNDSEKGRSINRRVEFTKIQ